MKRICMCNLKGGSGKSTATILLGTILSSVGKKVGIVDVDLDQKTLSKYLEIDGFGNENFGIYQEGSEYDLVIYDNEPKLSDSLRESLKNSDYVYITCSPSPPEVYSVLDTVSFLDKEFPELPRKILYNRVKEGTNLAKLRFDILEKMKKQFAETRGKEIEISALKSFIPDSVKYQEVFLIGEKALYTTQLRSVNELYLEII